LRDNPAMSAPATDPPPLRSHLAPFRAGSRAWLVLLRNSIPVIGVHALDWSPAVAVFEIWFDGVTALAAMIALQLRAFARTDPVAKIPEGIPPEIGPRVRRFVLVMVWLLLLGLLAIPYWFALFFFNAGLFRPGFWAALPGDPWLILALLYVLASNVAEEFRRGYERMSAAQTKLEFNWDFSMHLARIGVIMLAGFFFGPYVIIPLALALGYVEIYPMRSLRLFGGDATLEPGNERRSRD
jgi:hypothetical protein